MAVLKGCHGSKAQIASDQSGQSVQVPTDQLERLVFYAS